MSEIKFEKVDQYRWRIPQTGKMKVPGMVYATKEMLKSIRMDESPTQVANVAQLPGIVSHSIAMPDMHWGYGFPIGGVAAFDEDEGVLSPGGVGYDINCGVRLLSTNLDRADVVDELEALSLDLHRAIPSGVGKKSKLKLSKDQLEKVLVQGARFMVEEGYGRSDDLEVIEERGEMDGADPGVVSDRAMKRGLPQLGSLGSGNHFCELGYVEEIYEPEAAEAFGLRKGMVTVMIHSGSRGFGYQICDESLRTMLKASKEHGIDLPDRQLCAAPLKSEAAQRYFKAMACAINYAFANRQMMTHSVRSTMASFFGQREQELGLNLVYDVCHNIAKWETHKVDGKDKRVCVHRKGATRAFAPGHPDVPKRYRDVGQPVMVPGDMGRYSFVLAGRQGAMDETFGSSCHGAGRAMSRAKAKKKARDRPIFKELQQKGIYVRSDSRATVAEEIPEAYKDVMDVVDVIDGAGIAAKVCKLVPLAVVKG